MEPGKLVNVLRRALICSLVITLAGCSSISLKDEIIRDEPGYSLTPTDSGPLAELAMEIHAQHGDEYSGFKLLDGSHESLAWRLALMDSAVHSLDIQTYLWYPDNSGKLLLDRAIRAAERGVKVRLVVDDLLTIGLDEAIYELQQHANIEFRLFNPWKNRGVLRRAGQMIAEMERLNSRMHDKLMIADGRAAIVGGRNLGDHYFGLNENYNFHDLDVLGFGDIARQSSVMFDSFWNSEWVVSARNLDLEADKAKAGEMLVKMRKSIEEAKALESFPRLPKNWMDELGKLRPELHVGTSVVVFDETEGDQINQSMKQSMFNFINQATTELQITNAYIIPGQPAIDNLSELVSRGVEVSILTNSLESHDVPAVNSHYKDWRDDIILAGAALYEFRADAEVRGLVEVPPVKGEFVGLHSKAFVVDRQKVFIGSMNFDPRSANINTEAGVLITSPGLAEATAQLMERDMNPDNAWQVRLDAAGNVYWENSNTIVDEQPARDRKQRIMDQIFEIFPEEQY